jgi:hypothetical protein
MSRHRSGLPSGLLVGLPAALICAAGHGAALYYGDRFLPRAVLEPADGFAAFTAVSLVAGLLIGLAIRTVGARSRALPWWAAVYAAGAVALGWTAAAAATGQGPLLGGAPRTTPAPAITLDRLRAGLPGATTEIWSALRDSWQPWVPLVLAALASYALVRLRVRRVRHEVAARPAKPAPEEAESEPTYRAPFEPLQSPTRPRPAESPFAPRDQGQT